MTTVISELVPYLGEYWRIGDPSKLNLLYRDDNTGEKPDATERGFELAEELIALRYYSYIRYVWCELRSLLKFLMVAFVLLFLAMHSYAFRADEAIDVSFIVLFVVLAVSVGRLLYQQERNVVLSRMRDSKPDTLGKDFYLDLVKYGAIPLLTLLLSQIPSVSTFFLRMIQPGLQSLH